MKILPVSILAGMFVVMVVSAVIDGSQFFPDGTVMLVILMAALGFFSWHSYRLKFVSVDDNQLYVSGWFKHMATPLSNIESIYYSFGVGMVTVALKSPSIFGSKISFMPTMGSAIRLASKSPSVVDELRDLAEHGSKPGNAI